MRVVYGLFLFLFVVVGYFSFSCEVFLLRVFFRFERFFRKEILGFFWFFDSREEDSKWEGNLER